MVRVSSSCQSIVPAAPFWSVQPLKDVLSELRKNIFADPESADFQKQLKEVADFWESSNAKYPNIFCLHMPVRPDVHANRQPTPMPGQTHNAATNQIDLCKQAIGKLRARVGIPSTNNYGLDTYVIGRFRVCKYILTQFRQHIFTAWSISIFYIHIFSWDAL